MKFQKSLIYIIRGIFLIWSIWEGIHLEWLSVALLMAGFVLSFVPEVYSKWTSIQIPWGARLFLTVFLFASQFLGSYLGFYTYFSWWDMMLHLVSGIMVGYGSLVIIVTVDRNGGFIVKSKALMVALFVFALAVTGAVFWEIIEFTGDTFFGTNAQLGSLQDTMEDLICGTIVGGAFASWVGWALYKEEKSFVWKLITMNEKEGNA